MKHLTKSESELKRRLEDDEPLKKRSKLVENELNHQFDTTDDKEHMILEWLFKIAPSDTVALESLRLCIECLAANRNIIQSPRVKSMLIDSLIKYLDRLEKGDLPEEAIKISSLFLSTMEMHNFFKSEIDKFGLFLRNLFLKIATVSSTEAIKICISTAIDCLIKVYRLQSVNKEKLAEIFVDSILKPLCSIMQLNYIHETSTIKTVGLKCIRLILFGKIRSAEYKEYFQNDSGEHTSFASKIFPILAKQITLERDLDLLRYVFLAAFESYKNDCTLIDYFFRAFVQAIDDMKTEIFNSLVQYLTNLSLDYGHEVCGVSFKAFLRNMIDGALSADKFSNKEYCMIQNITDLNPLVVEDKLPDIFEATLLISKKTLDEEKSYIKLLVSILNASLRLRREQKVISWIFIPLRQALEKNNHDDISADEILPLQFVLEFRNFIKSVKSSQVIAMLRSLTFHLESDCIKEFERGPKRKVSLAMQCTTSLLVALIDSTMIFEDSVPLAMKIKFVAALGQLGDALSALTDKILDAEYDRLMTVALFKVVLSWTQIQFSLDHYASKAGAKSLPFPTSDGQMTRIVERAKRSKDVDWKNAWGDLLFYRIMVNFNKYKEQKKLSSVIGKMEDCWEIILSNYPQLISLLDSHQLSEFSSLILEDITSNDFKRWRKTFEQGRSSSENEKFHSTMLCKILKKIGSVMRDSVTASVVTRINLTKILKNLTNDAAVPALSREKQIREIALLHDLSEEDSSTIKTCLEILQSMPLHALSVPLRTMSFVMIYTINGECERVEGIKDLCEKILFEFLESGGLNVFNYIGLAEFISRLPESKALQKAFRISMRNSDPSAFLQNLSPNLDGCPDEAAAIILSSINDLNSKLNDEQKLVLRKVEKELEKKILRDVKKNPKSARRFRGLSIALKTAIRNERVKVSLKESVISALRFAITGNMYEEKIRADVTEEDENWNRECELVIESLKLMVEALRHRALLDLPDELVSGFWKTVLRHPDDQLLTQLLEASTAEVLAKVLETLQIQTETELRAEDGARLRNTLKVWEAIFLPNMSTSKMESRLQATHELLSSILIEDIRAEYWPDLMKLLTTIIKSRNIHLTGDYIDMMICGGCRSLREGDLPVCNEALIFCLTLLQSRIAMITDRLPTLLQLYIRAIAVIAREAKTEDMTNSQLTLCAFNVEKVTGALVRLKKDMLRVSPYIIADIVKIISEGATQSSIEGSFHNCINALQSIADSHGNTFLSRALPPANREIYKKLSENYEKYQKYTGKI